MDMTVGAVYIDSPIAAAVRQVSPFYKQGFFSNERSPLLMRKRAGTGFGLFAPKSIDDVSLVMVDGKTSKRLPVEPGGAVFYAFNGQGNIHTVANRSYRHVLVLHGESNKRASARPAARLYDYVCVAGDIATDRYLKAGIFRQQDVDQGRLIKTGDTFVQELTHCVADPAGDHILYAPTWEGYGGTVNDYSSINSYGFEALRHAARVAGAKAVVIRPHPYLGLLSASMLTDLIRGARMLSNELSVRFDLTNANFMVKAAVRTLMLSNGDVETATGMERVSLCICDISAMESVCLKAGLPHFVLRKNYRTPSRIKRHYDVKSAGNMDELGGRLENYMKGHEFYDQEHRADTFSVSDPTFLSAAYSDRFAKMIEMIQQDRYWRAD